MKLIFLGSGAAFTADNSNYHSNALLINEKNGESLLIDCGTDARRALHNLGYSHKEVKSVYISHLHFDHAGGLEWLALITKFDEECDRPTLFAAESVLTLLWPNTLSGGLNTIQGKIASLDTFFKPHGIKNNGSFLWEGITFKILQTMHGVDGFSFVPSYGLIFEINGTTIFFTTDTQFAPNQIMYFYEHVDMIFQDCETKPKTGVHAHFDELCTLPNEIKAKMWLYHYDAGDLPDAKKNGFCGFVQCGQAFIF